MTKPCPHMIGLLCSKIERTDEFYRQMHEAMLADKSISFVTGSKCPALSYNCIKLQRYKEKQK